MYNTLRKKKPEFKKKIQLLDTVVIIHWVYLQKKTKKKELSENRSRSAGLGVFLYPFSQFLKN